MRMILITLFAVTLLLFGCTGEAPQKETGNGLPPAVTDGGDTTDNVTSPTVEFDITAKQWEFEPSTITVKKGDTVKLTITSLDVDHGFALNEFNVNERLVAGETVEVAFTADKAGEFTFFCNVFCGSGHSQMNGKLIVEE
jgi:cytochrome c oxidase subunit 2